MIQRGLFGMTEEDIYQEAISRPLDKKLAQSILLIKEFEPIAIALDSRGYSVGNSGGKDSSALVELFKIAGVKFFSYYSNTTIDAPEVIRFLRCYHKDTRWLSRGENLTRYMVRHGKGLPTRIGRWCCEVYKEQSFNGTFKAIGVRADESNRRKGLWRQITYHSKTRLPVISPLLYWSDSDVWEFIRSQKLPYCELYDDPLIKRLGCIGCPLAGQKQMHIEFSRWPKYEEMWMRGARDFFNKWKDVPRKRDGKDRSIKAYGDWKNYWEWWITEGRSDSSGSDCQMWLW